MNNQRRRKAALNPQENDHDVGLLKEDALSLVALPTTTTGSNSKPRANRRSIARCRYILHQLIVVLLIGYLGFMTQWSLRARTAFDPTNMSRQGGILVQPGGDPLLLQVPKDQTIILQLEQGEILVNSTHHMQVDQVLVKAIASDQQEQQQQEHIQHHHSHKHAIPNVIIFTHYVNLLSNLTQPPSNKIDKEEFQELLVLQQNVLRIIGLFPSAQVRFLTDNECIKSIQSVFGPDHKNSSRQLVHYFRNERAGMYKADLCRGAALFETGGVYFDVDLGVRMNVFDALKPETTFSTVKVHRQSNRPNAFFQAFMAVTPQHAVIKKYVQLFLDFYQGKLPEYKGEPLGVVLLKRALDDVLKTDPKLAKTVELWQEVLYRPELKKLLGKTVPFPTWGTRRACKFIVMVDPKDVRVPFYSRIAGSRMCPINKPHHATKEKKITSTKR